MGKKRTRLASAAKPAARLRGAVDYVGAAAARCWVQELRVLLWGDGSRLNPAPAHITKPHTHITLHTHTHTSVMTQRCRYNVGQTVILKRDLVWQQAAVCGQQTLDETKGEHVGQVAPDTIEQGRGLLVKFRISQESVCAIQKHVLL